MNKNKFKKQLDSVVKREFVTPFYIENLFKNEKKSLFNNERIEVLIEDNFSKLMQGVSKGNIDVFLSALYSHDSMRSFLMKDDTLKYVSDNTTYYDFKSVIGDSDLHDAFSVFINNNIDYILAHYSLKKVVAVYENLELNEEAKKKIDVYFNEKKKGVLSELLTKTLSIRGNVDDKELDTLLNLVVKTVDKLLIKENCKISDMQVLMSGSFSSVLQIGDSIIKVGIPRKTFNIPNDKRILQPYIRKDLKDDLGVNAVIEVSDRVDTNITVSEDELYDIYKDMRSRGVVCGDFKYDNVGKLLKDNISHDALNCGMNGDIGKPLSSGEYVLFDTDFIYNEGDSNIELSSDLSRKFESRYLKEIGKDKEHKIGN